ncbi:transmembrane protein 119b isoform X2 [Narcine bancroftii]|uniref:transmembrane protein 119b isoform X2 n=1 Tax=Narcine bancroftii TaxID=1343680 RepID=UPI003831F80E
MWKSTMAIWLFLWQLVLVCICLNMAKSLPIPNITALSSAEASGSSEIEVTSTAMLFSTMRNSTNVDSINVNFTSISMDFTSTPHIISSKHPITGTVIMAFIKQYMVFVIIGFAMVLLLIIGCTVVIMKQSKGSSYYPASYPTRKYVDEQDKKGSSKNFEEVTGVVSDEPKEDTVNSSEQLQVDILSATHNLKKKAPSIGEEKQEIDAAGNGGSHQMVGQEGRNSTATREDGPVTNNLENNFAKAPEEDWKRRKEGNGNRKNEEEEEKDKDLETGVPGISLKQEPSSDMRSKSLQTACEPQANAAEDQSQVLDKFCWCLYQPDLLPLLPILQEISELHNIA